MESYQQFLKKIKRIVWQRLKDEPSGHDYWHCYRVVQNALFIGKKEKANLQVLELSGWLHDIAIVNGKKDHEIKSAQFSQKFLSKLNLDKKIIKRVIDCIKKHRFSKKLKPKTLEEKIIQDVDKLDALGAIGIAQVFAGGGRRGQVIYNPKVKFDPSYYLKYGRSSSTINHFYDKLFKLRKLLYTKTAQKLLLKEKNI